MTDPRATLSNGEVAHDSLRGHVDANRFTHGRLQRVALPVADLLRSPASKGPERQMLLGEPFLCLEIRDGFGYGRAEGSGYCGYVQAGALTRYAAPSHRVAARSSFGFSKADFKSPAPVALSLGSLVTVLADDGKFSKTDGGMYIPSLHLEPVDSGGEDPVSVAERLLGTPYLWGGNSAFGIDCSGLVQMALGQCGIGCPGDSDQQMQQLGPHLDSGVSPIRGDLLFWKGHVAFVAGSDRLIHANAYHMAVAYEPLNPAVERIRSQGDGPVLAHVRLKMAP